MTERIVELEDNNLAAMVCGQQDRYLRQIEQNLSVKLIPRGDRIAISGTQADADRAVQVLSHLRQLAAAGAELSPMAVNYALKFISQRTVFDQYHLIRHQGLSKNTV